MGKYGAGFVSGVKDSNGNIRPEGSNSTSSGSVTEELSEGDIEDMSFREKEDLVIDELGDGGKIRERKPDEKYIKVKTDSLSPQYQERLETWFRSEELSAMSDGKHLIEGTEPEEGDIDEVWAGIRSDVKERNNRVRERKKKSEIDQLKEFTKDPMWDKELENLTGEEFGEIISQSVNGESESQDEELSEAIQKIEEKWETSEPEVNSPDLAQEELQEAKEAWTEGIWAEYAEDLEQSNNPETTVESLSQDRKRIKTSRDSLKKELYLAEEAGDFGTEIVHQGDDILVAEVDKESKHD